MAFKVQVGTDRNLQIEADWVLTVVGDVDVLVQVAIDMLPLSAVGKVLRRTVQDKYWKERERCIC